MSHWKAFFLSGIFGIVLLGAVSVVFAAKTIPARAAGQEDSSQSDTDTYKRLLKIEKQIDHIRENQKQIEAKNSEIKAELASLKIWIYRR